MFPFCATFLHIGFICLYRLFLSKVLTNLSSILSNMKICDLCEDFFQSFGFANRYSYPQEVVDWLLLYNVFIHFIINHANTCKIFYMYKLIIKRECEWKEIVSFWSFESAISFRILYEKFFGFHFITKLMTGFLWIKKYSDSFWKFISTCVKYQQNFLAIRLTEISIHFGT